MVRVSNRVRVGSRPGGRGAGTREVASDSLIDLSRKANALGFRPGSALRLALAGSGRSRAALVAAGYPLAAWMIRDYGSKLR
jgi:hypothetical protein